MSSPLISAGIVTWNSAGDLPACLVSLRAQTIKEVEVIFVDNGSADDSLEIAAAHFPGARVIRNMDNAGFCAAHNQAIRASGGRYYLPLNPDVALAPDYLERIIEALDGSPASGLGGGKLLLGSPAGLPQRIDSAGLFLDRRRRQYLRGFGEIDAGNFDTCEEVFGIDGAAPVYRRAMLEDIRVEGEYFDEAFFAHKEDVDLAWRARLLGWRCLYIPAASAHHKRTFKPGQRRQIASEVRLHAVKNRYLLLLKNEAACTWRRDWLHILWYDLGILGYLLLFERRSLAAMGLLKRCYRRALSWREQTWQRVRVSPAEMFGWFK